MPATSGLTFERLLDWIEERLSAEEASAVAELVAQADESVQIEVARQRAFQRLREQTVLATPPPALRSALMQRFNDFVKEKESPNLLQRFIAALTFDSALQPGLAGVRTAATETPRQLIYSTKVADIVLNIQWRDQDEHADLFGQMLPNQADFALEEFAIQLLRESSEVAIVMADETGEFAFTAIPLGTYQLILSTDNTNIVLPPLELQPPPG